MLVKTNLTKVEKADMTSKSSLASAISGSHSVFLVTTPSWDASDPNAELVQGKNVADAAREAGVQHLIYSSLS